MRATPLATSIDPVQFLSIKQVYDTLVSADWFYDTEETRQDLADFIMRQYRKGSCWRRQTFERVRGWGT